MEMFIAVRFPVGMDRVNDGTIFKLDCQPGIILRYQGLVELFTRPDPNDLVLALRPDEASEVHYPDAGYLWNKNLASFHLLNGVEHKIHTVFQGYEKTSHPRIRDAQTSNGTLGQKIRDDAAPAADDIPIPHRAEARFSDACRIRCNKQLVR